jgi:PmbA protein
MNSMIDLCEYAVSFGEQKGVDEIEAVWMNETSISVKAQLGEVNEASKVQNEKIKIRVIKDRAISSLVTYQLHKDAIQEAVQEAIHAVSASKKDDDWRSLPSPGTYSSLDIWDRGMEKITPEDMIEPVMEMVGLMPEDISVYLALNDITLFQHACVNSNGIHHYDRGAAGAFGMMIVGKVEGGVTPGFDEVTYMRTYDPHPHTVAESLVKEVNLFRKSQNATSGESSIIFAPEALEILLQYTLFQAVSGENVARGKSLLAEKEDSLVADPSFTLHDNGIAPEGMGSREMDDEGVPCQDTPLIEEGILQGFIWNDYWAKREGAESTGNAHYNDRTDEIAIQQNCMVISPGDFSEEELFDIKEGYYVLGLQGAHGSNPESGDFSVVCTPALKITDGELTGGVTGMMLSDNIFSLLNQVDGLGKEPKVSEISILPPVRFQHVNIIAK